MDQSTDVLVRQINGKVDKDTVLSFETSNVSNSGENLVTELVVELPSDILLTYHIYFEFLLSTKERFISEPLIAEEVSVPALDQFNNPIVDGRKATIVRYKIPRYPTMIPGVMLVNVKATNDTITIYKSKVASLTVDDSVNSQFGDRYYRGDLLDYLVRTKIDSFSYKEGWLIGLLKIPETGELIEIGRYPINPLFPTVEAAQDFAVSDEGTVGQLLAVLNQIEGNPPTTTGYFINPDRTITKILTVDSASYPDLHYKPRINTDVDPGILQPNPSEELLDGFQLSKVAKSGRLSDLLNDRNFSTIKTYEIREAGVIEDDLPSAEGQDILIIDHITFNTALNAGDKFSIELGNDTVGWRTLIDQSIIDVTVSSTSYMIELSYGYTTPDILKITLQSESNNISVDVVYRHS